MLSIERLYTHTANVYRSSSVLLNGVTTVYTHTLGVTYSQPVVLEFVIPSGTASYTVTGLLNGLTSTSNVVFSSGSSIYKKQTDKSFDTILSIQGTTGTALNTTVKLINKSGQPYLTDTIIYSGIPCRFDNVGIGNPTQVRIGILKPDSLVCFVNGDTVEEESIHVDDKIQQVSLIDSGLGGRLSTTKYVVKNTNAYYNRSSYVYTELILEKVE